MLPRFLNQAGACFLARVNSLQAEKTFLGKLW